MRREEMPWLDVGRSEMIRALVFLVFFLGYFNQINAQNAPQVQAVQSVPKVDLDKYLGTWYEVAAIPQYFQRKCIRDTRATYSKAEEGRIEVNNQCKTESGESQNASGRARVVDTQSNSKLEVTFVKLFGDWRFWIGGDYWVIGLEENYQWAVVGHPSRKYGWVLSRTRALSPDAWKAVDAVLEKNGYDRCDLLMSPQTGGDERTVPMCQR
jgi:apolipoprotein D and lipocalin family protein